MTSIRNAVWCIFSIACLFNSAAYAEIKGSTTAVSIIANSPVFPALDNDNIMLEFGYFQGGFTLQDATTSCTFSSVFPVSGYVNMHGGTLILLEDLLFSEPVNIVGLGTIFGNNHAIEFCTSVTFLPANLHVIEDVNLVFANDVAVNSVVTVKGNCVIRGIGNTISFADGAGFVIESGAHLELQNVVLKNVGTAANSANVLCADNTGKLTLNNTTVSLANDWTFAAGNMHIKNQSAITGPHSVYYTSDMSSIIDSSSTLRFDNNLEFIFGKASLSSPEPLVLTDNSSVLECMQCTLHITNSGAQLTTGKLKFEGPITLESDSTNTLYGLTFGDHLSAEHDLEIYMGPASIVTVLQGVLTYNNVNGDGFINSTPSSILVLNPNIVLHLISSCTLPNNNLYVHGDEASQPTLLMEPEVVLYLENTRVFNPGETIYHGFFQAPYSLSRFFLDSNNSLYLANGSLNIPTQLIGASNSISGNGFVNSPIMMSSNASAATLSLQGFIDASVSCQGGLITLATDVKLTAANCFTTTGTINLGTRTLTLQPPSACNYSVPMFFAGNGGNIEVMRDITLTATWTFAGDIALDANGNAIIFDGGSIAVAPGGHLTIKNANLNNIKNNSVYCIDDTANITLYNVTWEQEADVIYSHGGLNYKGSVLMTGPKMKFAYVSTATSMVYKDTVWELDDQFTFSYAPSNNSPDLLKFVDYTSKIKLTHCTLYCVPGLKLSHGTALLQQYPSVYAYGDGLTIGDMTVEDSSADMRLIFLDNGILVIQKGALKYQNLDASSCQMWAAAAIEFTYGTSLYLYRTIYLNNGSIYFDYNNTAYYYGENCPIQTTIDGSMSGAPQWINMCE